MTTAEKLLVIGVLWILNGDYEHSWIGNRNGANDAFYIVSSWVFWIGGALMLVIGAIRLARGVTHK